MTPTRLIEEPAGPIRYGNTHIVRPRMLPRRRPPTFSLPSAGAIQLLVGPASSRARVQMNVSCSVRATSEGWLRWRYELGYVRGLSDRSVPSRSMVSMRVSYSGLEPSHHTTRAG